MSTEPRVPGRPAGDDLESAGSTTAPLAAGPGVDQGESRMATQVVQNAPGCVTSTEATPTATQEVIPVPDTGVALVSRPAPPRTPLLSRLTLHLSPAFFSLTMGTGIVSVLLHEYPYPARWLRALGAAVFVFNVVLFAVLALGSAARYVLHRGLWTATTRHPGAGVFWGTVPMGLATIINMIVFVCVPAWGVRWARLALGLWWIDVVMSVWASCGMLYVFVRTHPFTLPTLSPALLLPIVAPVVAAASGSIVASSFLPYSPSLARSTLLASYVLWGTGVPLALLFIGIWLLRALLHGPPAGPGLTAALFLPLGPCGQGGYGIVQMGKVVRALAYEHGVGLGVAPEGAGGAAEQAQAVLRTADAVYAGGVCAGLVLWGLGMVWYLLATALIGRQIFSAPEGHASGSTTRTRAAGQQGSAQSTAAASPAPSKSSSSSSHAPSSIPARIPSPRSRIPFNAPLFRSSAFALSLWALTFPLGVFGTCTFALASALDSPAFRVLGAVVGAQVVLHWVWVGGMTVWKVGSRGGGVEAVEVGGWKTERVEKVEGGGRAGCRDGRRGRRSVRMKWKGSPRRKRNEPDVEKAQGGPA